ncbi:MAG: hypothetical protein HY811_08720 [Planctomycetes bacterium]|nr:hypothetical protein [Planctomycetota bacterium]
MNNLFQKLVNLDRRYIYILVSLAVIIPLLYPLYIEINISPAVQNVYDTIESLPPRSVIFLGMDFDPASKAELYPMAEAILRHAFRKNLRVIGMTFWVTGTGLGEKAFADIAKETSREYGEDYVYLGWKAGGTSLLILMGEEGIPSAFPVDHYGKDTASMPVLENAKYLKNIDYLVELAAGSTLGSYYYYGKLKYKFKMGGGCTGVMAASWYNLMKIDWINGFLGGLRGAAEYEKLIKMSDKATKGMDAQSVTHMLIIMMIILCNIAYFIGRAKANQTKGGNNG